jgi:hypothetical protein
MRFILKATLPIDSGNDFVRDPQMGAIMEKVMGDIRPEAAYFAVEMGQRTVYFIVSVEKSSEITCLAEPLWLAFNADVEMIPVMNQEDFGEAMRTISDIVSRY